MGPTPPPACWSVNLNHYQETRSELDIKGCAETWPARRVAVANKPGGCLCRRAIPGSSVAAMSADDPQRLARCANPSILAGALFAALAVGLGAFGAHAMKAHYDEAALRVFETGVRYQMFHALALIACGALARQGLPTRLASWLFGAGILLFSGSLYGLVITDASWLGPITPLGGTAFLAGWIALAIAARKRV